MQSHRIESIDVTKGILLIMVLISNGCGFGRFGDFICACYMCAFFVLAGYTHKPVTENYMGLCKKRTRRLLLPFLGWTAVILIIESFKLVQQGQFSMNWLTHSILGALYSRYCLYPLGTDPNVFFLDKNGAMWLITALLCAHYFFYFALYVINSRNARLRTIEVLFAYAAIAIILHMLPILLPWSIDTAFAGAFFMLAGYLFRNGNVHLRIGDSMQSVQPEEASLPSAEQQKGKKLLLIDHLMIVLGAGVPYIMLVTLNPGINMSVGIYGYHGSWSFFLFLLIGLTGTILYVEAGRFFTCILPLKKFLMRVNLSAICLLALQFEIYDVLNKIMPVLNDPSPRNSYLYGLAKAALNLIICVIIDSLVRAAKNGVAKLMTRKGAA